MRIVILASSLNGTAANHLSEIVKQPFCEIAMVIYNSGLIVNKKRHYLQKVNKILRIGLIGALNGIRMRKWFGEDVKKYKAFIRLDELCEFHEIPFLKVDGINSDLTKKYFKEANADLGISLGNGYIAKSVFSIPKYGMINIHHEILPDYQNAQSIIWQLYNGSSTTGYTIHKIDKSIDTGEILFQERVPITFKKTLSDTVSFTSVALLNASAKGLIYVLKNFQELYDNAKPQGKGHKYTTPSFFQFLVIYRNYKKLRRKHLGYKW